MVHISDLSWDEKECENIIKGLKSEKLDIRGGNPNIYEKMIKKLAKI